MDTRLAPASSLRIIFAAFAIFAMLAAFPPHASAQDKKVEAAVKALQKKAMEEDYLTTEFAKAQDKLEKALAQCGADKCSAPVKALVHRDLGVVQIGGQLDAAKGAANFAEALKLDPNVQLDPDLKTKELEAAFEAAKKGGSPTPGPATQPVGDFTHEPVPEQQVRTGVPIYAEYNGSENIVKVIARYKGFGMKDWKPLELKKMGEKGWGGVTPCTDVEQGVTQYYLQGFNAENDPVAVAGDRNNPFKVSVTREKVAEPPHLPGQPAPTQCQDTGDCPPNFPGCKKPGGKPEEPTGKDGGETCDEDSECKSGTCKQGQCTDPPGKQKFPKIWVGLFGALDYSFIPSADDVCKLKNDGFPVNDSNYYCVRDGADFPPRPTGDRDRDIAIKRENDAIVASNDRGQSDKVSGGGALGNIRVMASLDYAATTNVLVGVRLGYVFITYPGEAAKVDGKAFPPIHLEVRGTYLIGKDVLTKEGFAPYVFMGAGVSTFESAVKVTVFQKLDANDLPDPNGAVRKPRDVDAYHLAGPGFVSLGGGGRFAFSPRAALMGGLRLNMALGNAFAASIGPELGVQFGF